jgi:hypothetical protein
MRYRLGDTIIVRHNADPFSYVASNSPFDMAFERIGRLGGLVRSEAKKRANKENGRKSGLVRSGKKTIGARRNATTSTTATPQENVSDVIALIRARFGQVVIGLDEKA